MPEQSQRIKSVKRKLNAINTEFAGKNVLLVDDSIVRGTTSKQIIEMAREAGASRVYMASAAPPVKHANVYGIDMPASNEFAADGRSTNEIAELINADKLFYQDLEDLVKSVYRKILILKTLTLLVLMEDMLLVTLLKNILKNWMNLGIMHRNLEKI